VCIGGNCNSEPELLRDPAGLVVKIQLRGLSIDLQETASVQGRAHHALQVYLERRPFILDLDQIGQPFELSRDVPVIDAHVL